MKKSTKIILIVLAILFIPKAAEILFVYIVFKWLLKLFEKNGSNIKDRFGKYF